MNLSDHKFVPHVGHFLRLDRLIFGVRKGVKQSLPKKDDLPLAADHGGRVFMEQVRAAVNESVRGVWVRIEFKYVERDEFLYGHSRTADTAICRIP
jgi:hypothetical protein